MRLIQYLTESSGRAVGWLPDDAMPTRLDGVTSGEHRLRLYRIDDNVVPQALLVRRAAAD